MSRFPDDETADGDVDMADVWNDDELLDQFGDARAAVSWNATAALDPALHLLGALRADVSDISAVADFSHVVGRDGASTRLLPVVDLAERRRRFGRRSLVGGAVALAVLSASGVAAAGIVSGRGAPLYPIHQLLLGDEKTSSQQAADKVRRHLTDAERALDRSRLADASRALSEATTWLARVDTAHRGGLATELAAVQARYAAAVAVGANAGNAGNGGSSGPGSGSGPSGRGSGSDDTGGSGSGSSGKGSGDDPSAGSSSDDGSGSSGGGSSDDKNASPSQSPSSSDDGSGHGSGSSGKRPESTVRSGHGGVDEAPTPPDAHGD
jgi:hypothetical protein